MTEVLKEIAEEEIDEVDIIMEDISDEIKDLQKSITQDFEKELETPENYYFGNVTVHTETSNSRKETNKV